MKTKAIMISPQMEQVVKDVAARHEMNWTQPGARLDLTLAGHTERWRLLNLDGERFSVTCYLVESDGTQVPEVDMVFFMHAVGWEPIELLYSQEAFANFLQRAHAAHLPLYDAEGNLYFDTFTEYWAEQLQAQGWAEQSQPVPEPEEGGRMVGCQSTNHMVCYGELWQCSACGKTVCCNEGSDDHPELCDDCWVARFDSPDNVNTQGVTFTQHGTLQLVCDCPEQCDTVLKLTHDGFLVLEDKDGLLVSFMLPDWLDFAMRRVMLAHAAIDDDTARIQTESVVLGRLEDDVGF
jgi:hypothetical protein